MFVKKELGLNVLECAKLRLIEIFNLGLPVVFAISGGKDSIVLNDILFKLCQSGQIDKNLLEIMFCDEEAMYDDVIEGVKKMRQKWLSIGVKFNWFCLEWKHFNCLNSLTQNETYITWDRYKKDQWIRPMPPYAIKHDKYLLPRVDTYQEWGDKYKGNKIKLYGIRLAESYRRMIAYRTQQERMKQSGNIPTTYWPLYDWSDKDVWLYIRKYNVEFPVTYMNMYKIGCGRKELRISQFFAVNTAKQLKNITEFYPHLYKKVCEREPNAYLISLYYDTEMFGKKSKNRDKFITEKIDYKEKLGQALKDKNDIHWKTPIGEKLKKNIKDVILNFGAVMVEKDWEQLYYIMLRGDQKGRSIQAFRASMFKKKG